MKVDKLTCCGRFAKASCNVREMQVSQGRAKVRRGEYGWPAALVMAASLSLGGCIQVNAPAEPIVIELNINIRQEVIYRLADDVRENIDENPDIF